MIPANCKHMSNVALNGAVAALLLLGTRSEILVLVQDPRADAFQCRFSGSANLEADIGVLAKKPTQAKKQTLSIKQLSAHEVTDM